VSRVAYILVALVVLALPGLAYASPDAVIRDCAADGDLDGHYSNSDLEQAQANLPSDVNEYSDCASIIAGAKTGGSDQGGGRTGGPNAHHATTTARHAEKNAQVNDKAVLSTLTKKHRKPRLDIGGRTVQPGSNGLFDLSSASNGLPLPLLLALIAVGVLSACGGLYALRRRVPVLARIPLPRRPGQRVDLSRVPFPRFRR
jgi:hypothetical protein